MLSPRAAAEITPVMKITRSPALTKAITRVAMPAISSRPSAISANGRAQPTRVSSASGSSWYARTAATDDCGSMAFNAPAVTRIPPSATRATVETHKNTAVRLGAALTGTGPPAARSHASVNRSKSPESRRRRRRCG